jgi:hypothetical protein
MSVSKHVASTIEELAGLASDPSVGAIVIHGEISSPSSVRLAPGQSLRGEDPEAKIIFAPGSDGIELSSDNQVRAIQVRAAAERRAIFNDTSVGTLGLISLCDVSSTGRVQIIAHDKVRAGHVEVSGLDIVAADARGESERPHGYGVSVIQGAFTLWNMQPDDSVAITADLTGLSAGRDGAPVLGSGIFVSGAGESGGTLDVKRLETGAVYSDGKIAPGTPDQITGGVFTVYGAHVNEVTNRGPVVTYGVNDMVLDNWGVVDRWTAEAAITSHGPSGIGFVNFGTVNELRVNAPIETFGQGARGFNVYTGTINLAEFDRIVTHGDGAVGIQIGQPIGKLVVHRGIETFGGTGQSLVKGVVVTLSAVALSIKPGGAVAELSVSGGIKTNGTAISPLELHGSIDSLQVTGGFVAQSGGFDS